METYKPDYLASYNDTQIACMSHALIMQMAEIEDTPIDLTAARQVRDEAEARLALAERDA